LEVEFHPKELCKKSKFTEQMGRILEKIEAGKGRRDLP